MGSYVSPKDEIWFLRVCHHISTGLYLSKAHPWTLDSVFDYSRRLCSFQYDLFYLLALIQTG
jgi:hypothetical protein